MENFTVAEINTLIEALDAWTTASQTSSMLAGLFLGAMICDGKKENAEEGSAAVKKFTEGEDDKRKQREETASLLKARLIQIRIDAEKREMISAVKQELNS